MRAVFLIAITLIFLSCQRDEFKDMEITDGEKSPGSTVSSGDDGTTSSNRLSSQVIGELQSNLNSSSSQRSSLKSAPPVSSSLTSSQIAVVIDAANQAVSESGLSDSENLIALLPKIIEGSQGSLKSLGLSGPETVKVVQVVVFSMTQSLNGRESYLPSSSADSGSSPLQTAISKVAKTSISRLDEAGISPSEISNASSSLVGTMVKPG